MDNMWKYGGNVKVGVSVLANRRDELDLHREANRNLNGIDRLDAGARLAEWLTGRVRGNDRSFNPWGAPPIHPSVRPYSTAEGLELEQ